MCVVSFTYVCVHFYAFIQNGGAHILSCVCICCLLLPYVRIGAVLGTAALATGQQTPNLFGPLKLINIS